ncbi:MAG: hypothetical protein NTU48_02220 [Legionellales bacterium]|nr:hypothetical protein [Legionellales bacterium]
MDEKRTYVGAAVETVAEVIQAPLKIVGGLIKETANLVLATGVLVDNAATLVGNVSRVASNIIGLALPGQGLLRTITDPINKVATAGAVALSSVGSTASNSSVFSPKNKSVQSAIKGTTHPEHREHKGPTNT